MCYCSGLIAYHTVTGKSFPLKCRSYTCLEHGSLNRYKLRKAISKFIENWDHVRLWTFTLSSDSFLNPSEHAKALSKAWRYFITQARRSNVLSPTERKVRYVRFSEPHKSGYFHFHIIIDRFILWYKYYALWLSAVESTTGLPSKSAGCHVKGILSKRNASHYVVKYVQKSANIKAKYMKLYTKSAGIVFFPKKAKSGMYLIHNTHNNTWLFPVPEIPLLEMDNAQRHDVVQPFSIWEYTLPPPVPFCRS